MCLVTCCTGQHAPRVRSSLHRSWHQDSVVLAREPPRGAGTGGQARGDHCVGAPGADKATRATQESQTGSFSVCGSKPSATGWAKARLSPSWHRPRHVGGQSEAWPRLRGNDRIALCLGDFPSGRALGRFLGGDAPDRGVGVTGVCDVPVTQRGTEHGRFHFTSIPFVTSTRRTEAQSAP